MIGEIRKQGMSLHNRSIFFSRRGVFLASGTVILHKSVGFNTHTFFEGGKIWPATHQER